MSDFSFYLKGPGLPLSDEVGFFPGKKFHCPRCDSVQISIVFKPGFRGCEIERWGEIICKKKISFCNEINIIKKCNFNPCWLCKDCYDAGVVIQS